MPNKHGKVLYKTKTKTCKNTILKNEKGCFDYQKQI